MRTVASSFAFVIAVTVVALGPACSSGGDDGAGAAPPAADGGGETANGCRAGELDENGQCVPAGVVCTPGFVADGDGCKPTRGEGCAVGTASFIGEPKCAPVGNVGCAAGFTDDGAGGCAPLLPNAPCTGATRERLGDTQCVPVSDCAAPFPPANATRFVDPTFDAGQLDPTHFRTIHDALAAAPAGSVIAVAAGTYKESLSITTAGAVTLVGRCAGQTVLTPPTPVTAPTVGVDIAGKSAVVTLRGLSVRGFTKGVVATSDTTLDGVEVATAAPPGGGASIGVDVWPSAKLTMTASVVRGEGAGAATSTFESIGVRSANATVALDDVTVTDVAGSGMYLYSASKVTAKGVAVLRTSAIANGAKNGLGIDVDGATSFDGERLAVRGASFAAFAAAALGTTAHVRQSSFESIAVSHFGTVDAGIGVGATESATVELTGCTVREAAGAGLLSAEGGTLSATDVTVASSGGEGQAPAAVTAIGGTLSLTRTSVQRPRFVGAVLDQGGTLHVSRVYVTHAEPDASGKEGGGLEVLEGSVDGEQLTIDHATLYGVSLLKGARAKIGRLAVVDTVAGRAADGTSIGIGLTVDQGASLELESAYVQHSVGLGALFRRAGTLKARGLFVDGVTPLAKSSAGYGLHVLEGSHVTLDGFAVTNAYASGIVAGDDATALDLTHGLLADARYDVRTATAKGISVQGKAHATLRGVRVLRSQGVAVYSSGGGSVAIEGSVISDIVAGQTGELGDAFIATDGATGTIKATRLAHASRAAAVFAGGTGALDHCALESSAIGLHVQDGSSIVETDEAADPAPLEVRVSPSTEFRDIATKVGSGTIPLPPKP